MQKIHIQNAISRPVNLIQIQFKFKTHTLPLYFKFKFPPPPFFQVNDQFLIFISVEHQLASYDGKSQKPSVMQTSGNSEAIDWVPVVLTCFRLTNFFLFLLSAI